MKRPLKIALPIVSSQSWRGGFNYMANLAYALSEHAPDKIKVVAYGSPMTALEDRNAFSNIRGIDLMCHPAFSPNWRMMRQINTLLIGLDHQAAHAFTKHHVDVVFESAQFFGVRLNQATIAWFPDFQHRKLSQLFSRAAWLKREIGFRMQLRNNRQIIVSSQDARHDCEKYYNSDPDQIHVLNFPAIVSDADMVTDVFTLTNTYDIKSPFIYVPNQLWKHKNHGVLIEALGILRKRGTPVKAISSGVLHDPRDKHFSQKIQEKLVQNQVVDDLKLLGVIPRSHVVGLLRICSALLNPSLSEGWSTTIEEAKLFGTPLILSDLAVHREQASEIAVFFQPHNAEALASLIYEAVVQGAPLGKMRALNEFAAEHTKSYADRFVAVVQAAWERHQQ